MSFPPLAKGGVRGGSSSRGFERVQANHEALYLSCSFGDNRESVIRGENL